MYSELRRQDIQRPLFPITTKKLYVSFNYYSYFRGKGGDYPVPEYLGVIDSVFLLYSIILPFKIQNNNSDDKHENDNCLLV